VQGVNQKQETLMNRIPLSRFTIAVRSSINLSILLIATTSFPGAVKTALAAQDPHSQDDAQKPQARSIQIPGTFKELPEPDKITGKRAPDLSKPERRQKPAADVKLDTEKVPGTIRWTSAPAAEGAKDEDLLDFHATAYCINGRTASGERTRPGVIAADPKLLPIGTVVHLRAGRYTGTYTVLDTGGRIKGNVIDVYVPTKKEAVEFGRRPVKLKVIGKVIREKTPARNDKVNVDSRP
jgi:3D (Asp-Asp-Asp) domain-containing protein